MTNNYNVMSLMCDATIGAAGARPSRSLNDMRLAQLNCSLNK